MRHYEQPNPLRRRLLGAPRSRKTNHSRCRDDRLSTTGCTVVQPEKTTLTHSAGCHILSPHQRHATVGTHVDPAFGDGKYVVRWKRMKPRGWADPVTFVGAGGPRSGGRNGCRHPLRYRRGKTDPRFGSHSRMRRLSAVQSLPDKMRVLRPPGTRGFRELFLRPSCLFSLHPSPISLRPVPRTSR